MKTHNLLSDYIGRKPGSQMSFVYTSLIDTVHGQARFLAMNQEHERARWHNRFAHMLFTAREIALRRGR